MLLSLFLAWAAVLFAVLAALKWLARISGCHRLNRLFFQCHLPFGVLLLLTGLLHGLLAGNPAGTALSDIQPAAVLFSWNWGSLCLLLSAGLGATYLLRKRLKHLWMNAHRLLTLALLLCIVLHLLDVGIQLPSRLYAPPQTTDAAASDTSEADFSGALLRDGTYSGSAQGYKGTITVSVTVSGGQVSEITVTGESDTPQFFTQAESVLNSILENQSLEVDAVTGATFSSAGLLNAVADALKGAVISGTLQINEIDLSTVRRHGH